MINEPLKCNSSCHRAHSTCLISHGDYWETQPWNFGGTDKGRLWGDGLQFKQCISSTKSTGDKTTLKVTFNTTLTHQEMMGFGGAMTGSAAFIIFNHAKRDQIMNKLFAPIEKGGIGISMLRIPVSLLSDFMAEEAYTYSQKNDYNLDSFSIDKDNEYFIPILKQALSINPQLKFIATPWSAPGWMKVRLSSLSYLVDDMIFVSIIYPIYEHSTRR